MVLAARIRTGWIATCGLLVALGVTVVRFENEIRSTRAELEQARIEAQRIAALKAEQMRLKLALPAQAAVEQMTAESDELGVVRSEVENLRQQFEAAMRAKAEKEATAKEKFRIGAEVNSSEWTNAGTGSPQSTLETALWAGAGGDVDALATILWLANHRAAQKVWEGAPDQIRRQHSSPERLIAFLTVRDIPLGSAKVRQFAPIEGWPNPAAHMKLLVRDENGTARDVNLLFTNPGDGWKLVVHPDVVAKYAAMLKSPASTAAR